MTELFLPPEGGADQVIRAARRRRQLKLSGLGSSAMAVAVGFAVVLTSGPSAPHRVDQVTTVPTSPAPTASSSPVPNVAATASGSRQPTSAGPVLPTATPSEGESTPRPTDPQQPERPPSPITRAPAESMATTDLCQDGNSVGSDWCLRLTAPAEIHRGTTVRLGLTVCRVPTASRTSVTFESSREVDVSVNWYDQSVVWQAGEGVPVTEPGGTLTFEPGQCYSWTAPWDTRDRDGFLLPPGDYGFGGGFGADSSVYVTSSTVTVVD